MGKIEKRVSKSAISFWLPEIFNFAYMSATKQEFFNQAEFFFAFQEELCSLSGIAGYQFTSIFTFNAFFFKDITDKALEDGSIGHVIAAPSFFLQYDHLCVRIVGVRVDGFSALLFFSVCSKSGRQYRRCGHSNCV